MLLALGSVKGSPGVSTLALALAACWPPPMTRLLVECDPAGGDLAVRFQLPLSPGLISLAAQARGPANVKLLAEHAQRLPGGLRVLGAPPGTEQARAAVRTLANAGGIDATDGAVVVVDCGRLDPDSPALPLVRRRTGWCS